MFVPFFMTKHSHIFTVDTNTYKALITGTTTHVEYTYTRKVKVGESINIRPYDAKTEGLSCSVINCIVKSIDEVPVKSGSIKRFLFGLNVQLILF